MGGIIIVCALGLWSLVFGLWSSAPACYADDVTFEAAVDKNHVAADDSVTLELTFHGTQSVPSPEISELEGFHARYIGPSTMMSIVNGKVSTSITHRYVLLPLKVGTFTIGPFEVTYQGQTYSSPAIVIEVSDRPVSKRQTQRQPSMSSVDRMNLKDDVFLVIEAEKARAYLNEEVPIAIKLYVNQRPMRDIQFPTLEHEGFSLGPLGQPRQYQERVGGVLYDVMEFETYVFGTRTGSLKLGPARLTGNLVIRKKRRSRIDDFFGRDDFFDDFFARYERYPIELTSKEIPMEILPLPAEGKPKDYSGAVGRFQFSLYAEPKQVNAGDPITLKMVIRGDGNFNTVTAPELSSTKGFKVYEPTVKQEDGTKIFEQVIIPRQETVSEIPAVAFSFFDPVSGTYRRIDRGPIPITVAKPEGEETLKIVDLSDVAGRPVREQEILGRDIIYIKETLGRLRQADRFLYQNKLFLALQAVPALFLLATMVFHKRRQRLLTDTRYARRLTAFKKAKKAMRRVAALSQEGKAGEFYDAVFKTMQEYLGDRFHIAPGGITIEVTDGLLKDKRIDDHILNAIKDLFSDCDMARYAPSEFKQTAMQETVRQMQRIIDYLERQRL